MISYLYCYLHPSKCHKYRSFKWLIFFSQNTICRQQKSLKRYLNEPLNKKSTVLLIHMQLCRRALFVLILVFIFQSHFRTLKCLKYCMIFKLLIQLVYAFISIVRFTVTVVWTCWYFFSYVENKLHNKNFNTFVKIKSEENR